MNLGVSLVPLTTTLDHTVGVEAARWAPRMGVESRLSGEEEAGQPALGSKESNTPPAQCVPLPAGRVNLHVPL